MKELVAFTPEQLRIAKNLASAISECGGDQQSIINIAVESMLVGVSIAEQQFSIQVPHPSA